MIPSTDETQTSSTENDTVSSFSLPIGVNSQKTILENSDKREHDNEELSFTTEMETITTEIETSSTIPHLRSLKSELSMETTDEE